MKNLIPINNSYSHFELIADSKQEPQRTVLNSLKPRIRNIYRSYEHLAENNKLFQLVRGNFNNIQYMSLLNCYKSKTKASNALKAEIRENQSLIGRSYCQYCMVRTPETFDHYVPIEEFSEYAVLSLNLIPCCNSCNSNKGTQWLETNNRIFLNLYYDFIVSYRVLFCSLSYDENIPIVRFTIRKNINLSKKENNLIKEHYSRLHLLELYEQRSNIVITETKRSFQSITTRLTKREMKNTMLNEVKSLKKDYGINYWEALIKQELSNSNEFFESIEV